jgi:hypothetical protein
MMRRATGNGLNINNVSAPDDAYRHVSKRSVSGLSNRRRDKNACQGAVHASSQQIGQAARDALSAASQSLTIL